MTSLPPLEVSSSLSTLFGLCKQGDNKNKNVFTTRGTCERLPQARAPGTEGCSPSTRLSGGGPEHWVVHVARPPCQDPRRKPSCPGRHEDRKSETTHLLFSLATDCKELHQTPSPGGVLDQACSRRRRGVAKAALVRAAAISLHSLSAL